MLLMLPGPGFAQTAGSQQAVIDGWRATLVQTEAALTRDGLALADLDQQRDRVQAVLTGARAFKAQLEPRLADLEAQISAIAPAPPEGSTETAPALPPEVQSVYDKLETERQGLATLVGQANVVILQGTQLLEQIAARREAFFNARLFDRSTSVLSPALWEDVGAGIPVVVQSVGRVLGGWLDRVAASSNAEVVLLLLAALAGAILVVFVRFLFVRWTHAWTAKQAPTPQRKVLMAGAVVLADIGVPMFILFGLRAILAGLGLLPVGIAVILNGIIVAVAAFTVITGMARALAAPGRPEWRIGGISDETARHAYRVVVVAAFLIALGPLADHLGQVAAMPPSWAVGVGGILSVPTALLALYATRIIVRGRASLSEDESSRSARWRILTPLAAAAAVVTIVAAAIGYLAFARFMIEQIAWVWVVAGAYVIVGGLAELGINTLFLPGHPSGLHIGRNVGISDRTAERLAILLGGLARIILFLLAALVVLAPWGFDSTSFLERASGLYYGIEIGSFRITYSIVITALAIFAAIVVLSRVFQRWLEQRFLPTTAIDPGLKNSINTAAGYIGFILAAILALSYAGINLANVALVAGALSVGIGFGLQSIVNNFVSGLILLAERPIRTGDWIQVGADEGTVRRISVRATEIETFDRASVIIPNSSLISGVVKNWYLRDSSGRTTLIVGVSYDADPEQVRQLMLECALKHEMVLKFPKPFVNFENFGDSALVFQLFVYLASISNGGTVRSDLRFAILRRFREEGIEIPYPRRDISVRDWPTSRPSAWEAGGEGSGKGN
jgi:small-conductance mechanosensitive channel